MDIQGKKRRLLFVTYPFPPMCGTGSFQALKIVRAMARMGWDITVICAQSDPRVVRMDTGLNAYIPKNARIIRVPCDEYYIARIYGLIGARRDTYVPDIKLLWYTAAVNSLRSFGARMRPDIVFSRSAPFTNGLVAVHASGIFNIPHIAYFSDPWVDSPYLSWLERLARPLHRKHERDIIENAKAVIFTNDYMKDIVMKKYAPGIKGKALSMPQAFDSDMTASLADDTVDNRDIRFNMTYVGEFYGIRTPMPLFKAIAILKSKDAGTAGKLSITIVGDVNKAYVSAAAEMGLNDIVTFIPPVTYLESLRYMKRAGALLLIDADSKKPSMFLPAKLVDYLPFRKMILGITPPDGASAKLVREYGGYVVSPGSAGQIADGISRLIKMSEDGTLGQARFNEGLIGSFDYITRGREMSALFERFL